MPITPSALAKVTKACSFDYAGESVTVTYRPAAITVDTQATLNKLLAQANAAQESNDEEAGNAATLAVGTWLCSLITHWDFFEDDGETMQAITPEHMTALLVQYTDFLTAVVSAIMEDRNRGKATGTPSSKNSEATSPGMASLDSATASQSRSDLSSSPGGSEEAVPLLNG